LHFDYLGFSFKAGPISATVGARVYQGNIAALGGINYLLTQCFAIGICKVNMPYAGLIAVKKSMLAVSAVINNLVRYDKAFGGLIYATDCINGDNMANSQAL